jgi:hypothetical protein
MKINTVKTIKSRKLFTIAIIVTLIITVPLMAYVPAVSGDTPTYAFVTVSPDPAGVDQEVSIIMWIDKIEPTAAAATANLWKNFRLEITKPDRTTENLGPFTADPSSFAFTLYYPDQIGEYTIDFTFPGQQVTGFGGGIPIPINEYYEASSSSTTLTVQEEQITPIPQTPLPNDFWTRPIDAQNQEWYTISGNWFGTGVTTFGNTQYDWSGNFNPYSQAPNSAHVVWTKPMTFGGLIGGEFGGTPTSHYYTGKSYEPKFTPPVIINGVLYYNAPKEPREGFYAVDLRTGETLWWQNSTGPVTELGLKPADNELEYFGYAGITFGQVFNYRSPNEEGGRAYLWYMGHERGAWGPEIYKLYDAATGQLILTFANASEGTSVGGNSFARITGPNGELLVYLMNGFGSWLALWNSTKAIGTGGPSGWTFRPEIGATLDWQRGIQWNVTIPPVFGQTIYKIDQGIILAITGNLFLPQDWQMEVAYDAETGAQLWIQNRTTPKGATTFGLMGPFKDGVYTEYDKGARQWRGFSGTTGQLIWGPTEPYTNPWDSQAMEQGIAAYGNLYDRTLAGIHALDLSTGEKLWDFFADSSGTDWPGFSTFPFLGGEMTIADNKVFVGTSNSHGDPLFRGAQLYAIDAMSGEQVWNINGFFLDTMPVADGYLVGFNGYDNQIYCFGKGKTITTVTAPDMGVPLGSNIMIRGMVTDQSPGAEGTAAIADEDMTAWMEYLHMQQPIPTDAKGVDVTIDVIDANGNYRNIGTATSDMSGFYSFNWMPDIPGKYTVIATFEGSESYWSSYSETAFVVEEASEPTPPPEPTPAPMTDTYVIGLGVAALIAIVVFGLLILLMLRKK